MGSTNYVSSERGKIVVVHGDVDPIHPRGFGMVQAAATAQEYNRLDKLDTAQLLGYYERGQRRLFLLDYDGTLVNYQSMEELAEPSPALLSCLEELTADPRNTVYIICGRNKNRLQVSLRLRLLYIMLVVYCVT